MPTRSLQRYKCSLLALVALLAGAFCAPAPAQKSKFSELGRYEGYSEKLYDGWKRESLYVPMRDGVRLAVDVLRPTKDGQLATERLPALWTHHRYHRADKSTTVLDFLPWLEEVLKHGYVVCAADVRGSGASFGSSRGMLMPEEARDGYDVTEWIAAQPWCDGSVGMYGGSYLGMTQYMTAGMRPPHLKAIVPTVAGFDMYGALRSGGIYREDVMRQWSALVKGLDTKWLAAPVDADARGEQLALAAREHEKNRDVHELLAPLAYRDSQDEHVAWPWLTISPLSYAAGIETSGVAVYHIGGWHDLFARDTILWWANLSARQRLTIGPWAHIQRHELDHGAEHLRWFDRWLKGIDNGVDSEDPVHYYVLGENGPGGWRSAPTWPPPGAVPRVFYFGAGKSGTAASLNDGTLVVATPAEGADEYYVDYRASSGKPSRWSNAYGAGGAHFRYPDMSANDARGLTWTGPPLAGDLLLVGHPVAHLHVSSTAQDGDFFLYLERIEPDGRSTYLTEGCLRASHRVLGTPPHRNLGLPYHRHYRADYLPLEPGVPAELVFDLYPLAARLAAGTRLRFTLTCSDRQNQETPELDPSPLVRIHRGGEQASRVVVPVLPED